MSKPKKIKIDDQEYVRADSVKQLELNDEDYVIIRTYSAGVHAGYLHKKEGNEVVLKNARRIWYWDGAATLSQLAVDGTSKPENCKFPCAVPEVTIQWIEIIPCTKKAKDSIEGVKVWEQ